MADWVTVAGILRPRGNRGEVVVQDWTTGPQRFLELESVTLVDAKGEIRREAKVEHAWSHQGQTILKFQGIDSISSAEELSGLQVVIPASKRRTPAPDEYFIGDLVGCQVVDADSGEKFGPVSAVHENTGASGLLELQNGILIPFVREICIDIRPVDGLIRVRLPDGLAEIGRESNPETNP